MFLLFLSSFMGVFAISTNKFVARQIYGPRPPKNNIQRVEILCLVQVNPHCTNQTSPK